MPHPDFSNRLYLIYLNTNPFVHGPHPTFHPVPVIDDAGGAVSGEAFVVGYVNLLGCRIVPDPIKSGSDMQSALTTWAVSRFIFAIASL